MSTPAMARPRLPQGALGIGALAAAGACAPGGGTSAAPSKLASPPPRRPQSAKGKITIWNRSGDLFKVFDAAIGKFREAYPGIKVNHLAVDIDTKLPNTLISGTDVPDGSFLGRRQDRRPVRAPVRPDRPDRPYHDKVAP